MDTVKVATLSMLSAVAGAVATAWALEHDVVHKAIEVLGLHSEPAPRAAPGPAPRAAPGPAPRAATEAAPEAAPETKPTAAPEAKPTAAPEPAPLIVYLDKPDDELVAALDTRGISAVVVTADQGPDGSNCSTWSSSAQHPVVRRTGHMQPHTCAAYVALHSLRDAGFLRVPVGFLLPVHSEHPRAGMPYFNTLALLQCPAARDAVLRLCVARVQGWGATVIVAYETRALVWASALATMCHLPLVAARREEDTMGMQVVASVVQEPSHRAHAQVCVDSFASREDDIVVVFDDVVNSGNTMRALKAILQPMCARVHDLVLVNCHNPEQGLVAWAEA
jgi:adenine/guanine phosphoribosyltransferase-like PRPP-binding protein